MKIGTWELVVFVLGQGCAVVDGTRFSIATMRSGVFGLGRGTSRHVGASMVCRSEDRETLVGYGLFDMRWESGL